MKLLRVAATAVASALMLTATPATAHAGSIVTHCAGTKAKSAPLRDDAGHTRGRLEFWRHSDGRRCAMVYDKLAGRHSMSVQIDKMDGAGFEVDSAKDSGRYEYYAGGAQVREKRNRCYQVSGRLIVNGHYYRKVFHRLDC